MESSSQNMAAFIANFEAHTHHSKKIPRQLKYEFMKPSLEVSYVKSLSKHEIDYFEL